MATVPTAVFHSLDFAKLPYHGLRVHLFPVDGSIFGLAHPGHAKQVEFAVEVGYELHQGNVGKPTVHQQVLNLNS